MTASGPRPAGRPRRSRIVASSLLGVGGIASTLCVVSIGGTDAPTPVLVGWTSSAVFGLVAAVIVWKACRAASALGCVATAAGLIGSIPAAALPYWLVPGLLLGFGAALAAGARFTSSPRTTAIVLTVIGASASALLMLPVAYAVGVTTSEEAPLLLPPVYYWLESAAVLGFVAAALMARWLRVGGVVSLLAVVSGLAGFVASAAVGDIGLLALWLCLPGGLLLAIAGYVALRKGSISKEE